jgi:hypothetical protein
LTLQWKEECRWASSLAFDAPTYQEIIAMGTPAIPWLLRELSTDIHHWGYALEKITGENPVPEQDAGDLRRVAEAWIKWGKENGHIR